MAFTTVDIKTTFDRVNGEIVIQDITDYAGQGVNLAVDPAEGFLKVEYNTGSGWNTIYYNLPGPTPDINPPNNYTNQTAINIPLSGGLPLNAIYRINYVVNITNTFETANGEFEYEYYFIDPEVCIDVKVDCQCSKITSTDISTYVVGNATLNSITRSHTLYPPPTSNFNNLTANVVTLVYTPIVTKTWTAEVVSTLSYVQANGLYVDVEISGTKEFTVVCDTTLGKVLCCLTQIDKTYNNYLCKSPTKAENYAQTVVEPTWHYITLFLAAQAAGDQTKAASAYQKILDYSGCGDCNCNDAPTLVSGCGSGAGGGGFMVYALESQDASIDISQSVVGNTTTFNIEVSSALQNVINNIGNAFNVVGTAPYINVTSAGTNPKTFTVAYSGPVIHTNQIVQKQIVINPFDATSLDPNYLVMNVYEIANQGPNVAATPHSYKLGFNVPNAQSDTALIYIKDFLDGTATKRFVVNAMLNKRYPSATVPLGPPAPSGSSIQTFVNCRVEVFHTDFNSSTGLVVLRVVANNGVPYSLAALNTIMANEPMVISLDINILP